MKPNKFLLDGYHFPLKVKNAVAELHGVASSLVYDGRITENESKFLSEWLETNRQYCVTWPLTDLAELMDKLNEDGGILEDERLQLFDFLAELAKPSESNQTPKGVFSENPQIVFPKKWFLFTGDMKWGERPKAIRAVRRRKGYAEEATSFTLKINYLVVGSQGSEYWKHKGFGTKVEKALNYIREGKSQALIVKEEDFVKALIHT